METSSQKIVKNIIATITYYDCLDWAPTAFELWRNLIQYDYSNNVDLRTYSYMEILAALKDEKISMHVRTQSGFYFLKGREELVLQRIHRGKISSEKMKRLGSVVRWMRYIPFVRMVAVTGKLSMKNAHSKSDWDVLIVLKNGKIWTGRTLVTLFLQFVKKRRKDQQITDRVCLNYFVTDDSLEIITKDLFSANEYMCIYPLFGWKTFESFQLRNKWIRSMKPHYEPRAIRPMGMLSDTSITQHVRKLGEKICDSVLLENWLRAVEKGLIMANPKTHQEGSLVYANDDALVFLPNPHGPKIFEKFKEKIDELL